MEIIKEQRKDRTLYHVQGDFAGTYGIIVVFAVEENAALKVSFLLETTSALYCAEHPELIKSLAKQWKSQEKLEAKLNDLFLKDSGEKITQVKRKKGALRLI